MGESLSEGTVFFFGFEASLSMLDHVGAGSACISGLDTLVSNPLSMVWVAVLVVLGFGLGFRVGI
ncbi:MAG: hypothetical protein CMF28_04850 [Kiritimatiellaceae bacterium]|nr:hypothetical protein [Kiritimatiellaceae bacterium]